MTESAAEIIKIHDYYLCLAHDEIVSLRKECASLEEKLKHRQTHHLDAIASTKQKLVNVLTSDILVDLQKSIVAQSKGKHHITKALVSRSINSIQEQINNLGE
jgi:hypothetical protein